MGAGFSSGAPERAPSTRRSRILIVDDRQENIRSLEVLLEPLRVETDAALSGAEALRKLLERDYAVILLDVQMPELDGFETARSIRGRKRSESTPIVFLTANYADEEYEHRGYELGAVDYLSKPIVREVLLSKVRVFCELFHKSQALAEHARNLEREVEHLKTLASGHLAVSPLPAERQRVATDFYGETLRQFLSGEDRPERALEAAARMFELSVSGRQFIDIHLEVLQAALASSDETGSVQRARFFLVAALAHLAEAYQNSSPTAGGCDSRRPTS